MTTNIFGNRERNHAMGPRPLNSLLDFYQPTREIAYRYGTEDIARQEYEITLAAEQAHQQEAANEV